MSICGCGMVGCFFLPFCSLCILYCVPDKIVTERRGARTSHWICSWQARAFPVRTRCLSLDNPVVPGSAPEVSGFLSSLEHGRAADGHELPKDRSPTAFPQPAPSVNLNGKRVPDSLAEMQLSLPRHQAFLTETLSLP